MSIRPASEDHLRTTVIVRSAPLRVVLSALVLGLCLTGLPGYAQSSTSSTSQSELRSGVSPPALIDFVEAVYPPAARAAGQEGTVGLKLTIAAGGAVTAAEVVQSAGDDFDAAAREAALKFLFKPATRGGVPVAAKILYTYEFALPKPPPAGDVEGRLYMPDGVQPAVGVEVEIQSAAGQKYSARSDDQGRFAFSSIPPANYQLSAKAEGLGAAALPISVADGQVAKPKISLLSATSQEAIDVTVQGKSKAQELRESAAAVHVVETEAAQQQAADLGEVLAREQGVGVQRGGALGSTARFSLNGLTDDQIRFFLDGVPLYLAGYPFGIANVPVNFVERAEVYRGVVPIRFGADALGGAVNLVSDDDVDGTHGSLSYQMGSFGTQRLTLSARHLDPNTGVFVRATGFLDYAKNNYTIDVNVADDAGQITAARVHRFHDAYLAYGGNLEIGAVNLSWADRVSVRAFASDFNKEIQNNIVMTVPYGEPEYGQTTAGALLRYEKRFGERVEVEAIGGYTYGSFDFLDLGECIYNWYGQCVRDRPQPGEISGVPIDRSYWAHTAYARGNIKIDLNPAHAILLSVAPTYTGRKGEDHRRANLSIPDPLAAQRQLTAILSGIEHQLRLFEERLENRLFIKSYIQFLRSEEVLNSGLSRTRDRDTIRFGFGDGLRYRFMPWLYAKASYEFATRLPTPDEVFGDGAFIVANLELQPETSHNANLGLSLDIPRTTAGAWRSDVNGFLRDAHDLIRLFGTDVVQTYQNVFSARSIGVELAAGWTSPGDYLALDGNITYVDFRNTSDDGLFQNYEGDRIPNRPYFFANASARFQLSGVATSKDQLSLFWYTRYVHEYYRSWESIGSSAYKLSVDGQLIHSASLNYTVSGRLAKLSFTAEVQNLSDARAYDFFGVQRPGRAFYFKTTAAF